ncbi:MAG: serine/threonine protein kinase [Acidobacteria bacterium]|uniref:Serine/threonine protein kinase n=1 Tax=Candidatus Polarisedimenticola svalbardensis TaxID=2886004 RepID=A0A8J6Y4I5_9BACT|nr:serine/threonine protein kinase [Candidatus Polarisedimenticola svalbardensis]
MSDDNSRDDWTRTADGGQTPDGPKKIPDMIGEYRILGVLGEGGQGVVYEAEQASPKRKVAIKVVRGGEFVDETRVRMFQREAETLARLKHPDIGAIYESGRTADGQHFFAMELVRGQTLDKYLEKRSAPTSSTEIRFRLALLRKIAGAVNYAHQRGVIHRDLKPANIIITDETDTEVTATESGSSLVGAGLPGVKILDFGLARITEGDIAAATMTTEIGMIKGTLPYMAPEQARGDSADIDVRADVYALGVILYEMLSGKRPYDVARRALIEAVRVICEEKPASLRGASLNSRVIDPDIETIVGKALEKESNRRYGSAAELSGDIGRFLTSQPILARPPSAVYQMQKLVSRHRVPATMAGVMLVALIGFVIGMSVLYVRAVRAEADASRQAETATRALDFMTGMFETSDPSEAKGNVVTAREVLDAGARRIDLDLADQPVVQATLMRTMGEVYYNLGLYGESERLLERALEQRRALLGDDHLDTLAAVQALAQLYEDQGKSAEAEQLLADALERSLRLVGPDARVTINIRAQLAGVYQDQGRMEEAEEAHTAAVDAAREHLGPDDHDTLSMISDLASLYNDTARMDQAEELMQDVLEIRRERLGNDHPETLRCVNNLALIYQYQGKYDNSEELFLEVVEAQTRILGAEHQETLLARNNLVVLRVLQGRFDDAETICNEILKLQRDKLGPDHPDVLRSIMNLAVVYQRQNRLDEAKDELLYVLERYREILGDDHPETMMAASNVAVNFMFKGDNDEAERRYRELVERSTRVLGPDHPDTTIAVENLGNVRYRQGDLDESEALVRQVMESRNRVLGPEHPASLRTRGNLSVVLKNKGDLDAAQILAEEAVEIQRKALGNDHFDVANALENLAALRREQGAFGDAATHMREAVRIRRVVYGDESTEVAESLMTLARELLAGEAWAEAEEAGNQALVLRRDILKVAETENLGLRNFLVQMKINQATYAEAEQQALQFYEDVIRLGETDRATKMASKLVTIYEGLGNEAEAARWQRDAGN